MLSSSFFVRILKNARSAFMSREDAGSEGGVQAVAMSSLVEAKKTGPVLVSIFTQKGGVGKTTSTFNIACLLAKTYGMKVLMVDADPQCNLTALSLRWQFLERAKQAGGKDGDNELVLSNELDSFYRGDELYAEPTTDNNPATAEAKRIAERDRLPVNNLYRALALIRDDDKRPDDGNSMAIDRVVQKTKIEELKLLDDTGRLFILPSSMDLYLIDNLLTSYAYSKQTDRNSSKFVFVPSDYIKALARQHQFDIVFIDLSPNIGGLNQGLLLFSDYFMMPGNPGFFTNQAISSIARALPRWVETYSGIGRGNRTFSKFLALYMQKVKSQVGVVGRLPNVWITKIRKTMEGQLIPVSEAAKMLVEGEEYKTISTVSLITDTALEESEAEGLPIACLPAYQHHRILANKKQNLAKYQGEFLAVVKESIGIIVRTDSRLETFKEKFRIDPEDIDKRISFFLTSIQDNDFSQVLEEEFEQEAAIGSDDLYSTGISSMLRLLQPLMTKFPQSLANPCAYPDTAEFSESFEKQMRGIILPIKKIKIIPFYIHLKWIVLSIKSTDISEAGKVRQDIKIKLYAFENLSVEEEEIARALVNFFYQNLLSNYDGSRTSSENFIQIEQGAHPINQIKIILDKFLPRKSTGPLVKPQGASTVRKKLLESGHSSEIKKSKFKKYENLHKEYISDLVAEFERFQSEPHCQDYKEILALLIRSAPQLNQEFSKLTQIVIVHAILFHLSKIQNIPEDELKPGNLMGGARGRKRKLRSAAKKRKRELEKHLVTFLGVLLDRAANAERDEAMQAPIDDPEIQFTGMMRRPAEQDIFAENKEQLVRLKTGADGNCAIHAIFGVRIEDTIICPDADEKRRVLKAAILACKRREDPIYDLAILGIQALIMSGRAIGPHTKALLQGYQKAVRQADRQSPVLWDQFEASLNKFPDIIKRIHVIHKIKKDASFREKFYDALNRKDDEVLARIQSIVGLNEDWMTYNQSQSVTFPWDQWSYEMVYPLLSEYANFLGGSDKREHLVQSEVCLIAHVFKKTVHYYPFPGARVNILNPGQAESVIIRFNGENHFERLEVRAVRAVEPNSSSASARPQPEHKRKARRVSGDIASDRSIVPSLVVHSAVAGRPPATRSSDKTHTELLNPGR